MIEGRASAATAIVPQRLDIGLRLPLARILLRGVNDGGYASHVYRTFLKNSNPFGKFGENGTKHSLEDYEKEFLSLCKAILKEGYDPGKGKIPIGKEGFATNGAHRLAIATVLNSEVQFWTTEESSAVYDEQFLRRIGTTREHMDLALLEMSRAISGLRLLVLFDVSKRATASILNVLREGKVMFGARDITLEFECQKRLMYEVYGHNPWWQESLATQMALERFGNSFANATFILVDGRRISDFQGMKESLRQETLGGKFPRKIHGTDNDLDTRHLSELIFSRGGRDFLNTSTVRFDESAALVERVPKQIANEFSSTEAISGSTVYELHGLRRAADLDYVACGSHLVGPIAADDHSHYMERSPYELSRLVHSTELHFVYRGKKFLNLATVAVSKGHIGGHKNLDDVRLWVGATVSESKSPVPNALGWRLRLLFLQSAENLVSKLPMNLQAFIRGAYRWLAIRLSR